ncbi:MAG: formyltetrahydrofolate deformylase [Candidatus Hydrogenedentota bacterium]|nr:MAG: formyltetrahydrofolate deformylase [Candidatus Hydrogenedentota bacterium]
MEETTTDPRRPCLIIRVTAPDEPGLIRRITGVLFDNHLNIIENHEAVLASSRTFFMRTCVEPTLPSTPVFTSSVTASLQSLLQSALPSQAEVAVLLPRRKRIVILASREYHCLGDLLLRHSFGDLKGDILAVISNHRILEPLCRRFEIPFHYIPTPPENHLESERRILEILDSLQPEYLVLAKYMRVLSKDFVLRYPNRILNIHHSFLPAFQGARPYHQAFERGVKVIGATAHFVTPSLDEGPIIVQDVIPVERVLDVEEMTRAGREIERSVLARALRLVMEDRVFVQGNRTVVFT